MEKPIERYWQARLQDVKAALEANNFEVFLADSSDEAKKIVLEQIIPKTGAKSITRGGSMTLFSTGLSDALRTLASVEFLDPLDNRDLSPEEKLDRYRQAFLSDLFISGTNAVTETGMLVNLDMTGNRVAALTFGPRFVAILVGRNKIVGDLDEAMFRIKNYVAPANAMRLDKKTPCVKTSHCEECKSPDRICNHWVITEKSFPKGRVKVVLINEELGL